MSRPIDNVTLRRTALNSIFCLFIWMIYLYLQDKHPFAFIYLLAEDWWGEYATFVSYLVAFGLVLAIMKANQRLRKPGYILMALGFLFIALEEISWGQRLLNIQAPYLIEQLNYQSELNLHNTVNLEFSELFSYVLIIWIFALPILSSRVKSLNRWLNIAGIPMATLSSTPCFLLPLYIILGDSLIINEPGELSLGLAFICYTTEIYVNTINAQRNRKLRYPIILVLLLMLIVGLTAVLVKTNSLESKYNWRLYHSAVKSYPDHKLYNQAEVVFEYMINNPAFVLNENLLIEYGELLKKMGSPKADYILRMALDKQRQFISQKPDQPKYYRNTGKILTLLNAHDHARQEFQAALEKDRLRLQEAESEWERSYALYSTAKTYAEMKNYALAVDYARQAYPITPTNKERTEINEWIEGIEKNHSSSRKAAAF